MTAEVALEFHARPSALRFMLDALRPSPGLSPGRDFPRIAARWRQHRVDRRQLADFLALAGLPAGPHLPIICPHVFGFRLQMVVLTHPAYPLPIWQALQIRNHLLQHRPIPVDSALDLATRVAGHRILEKGAEVDLHTTVAADGEAVWESLNTFYYRGRYGEGPSASPPRDPPPVPAAAIAHWRQPPGVGWRLARMTGDYNGIHHWHWYARRLGFPKAFFHPQLMAGQCMARLPSPPAGEPQRLELWLKGPIYFGSEVVLRAETAPWGSTFALMLQGDERAAILGRWSEAGTQDRLVNPADRPE